MANNRMYLVCNICIPGEWKEISNPGVVAIAKWYPGAPYYSYGFGLDKLNDFLDLHGHDGHEYPIRLEYECPQEAREIKKP